MYYYQQRISLREIKRLHEQNLIIDAKDGGLLLGPSHKEGGILFLFEIYVVDNNTCFFNKSKTGISYLQIFVAKTLLYVLFETLYDLYSIL